MVKICSGQTSVCVFRLYCTGRVFAGWEPYVTSHNLLLVGTSFLGLICGFLQILHIISLLLFRFLEELDRDRSGVCEPACDVVYGSKVPVLAVGVVPNPGATRT